MSRNTGTFGLSECVLHDAGIGGFAAQIPLDSESMAATEDGMVTVAPRSSNGTLELVLQAIDDIEFVWFGLDEPGPQTESSIERGFRHAGPVDDEWGRSESLDPANVGDIADEGPGHRG